MAAITNFLQWNPSSINQQTDGTYATDAQRVGGAVTGIFPSDLANKLYYQTSTLVAALATVMVNKGYEMQDTSLADLITSLSNILTKAEFGTGANTVCQGNDDRLNVPGTKMWFYQNVAPTGWTIDATAADAVLAVKGGSNAYYVAGGTQSGTWTQAAHTHTGGATASDVPLPAHSHTLSVVSGGISANHTHAISADPGHYHYVYGTTMADEMYGGGGFAGYGNTGGNYTQWAGVHSHGGATGTVSSDHTHTISGNSASAGSGTGSHTHTVSVGANPSSNTWRPLAQVGIICTKN
jgi:hypothetical protein